MRRTGAEVPGMVPKDPSQSLRLLRRAGSWRLEFTELVSVDEHLLRPERRQIASPADVARYLTHHCPPQRSKEAQALMGVEDDGSDLAFELDAHGWMPAPTQSPSLRPLVHRDIAALVTDFENQLAVMRRMHDALLARIVKLEAHANRVQASLRPPRSVGRVPSRRDLLQRLTQPESSATPASSGSVDALGRTAIASGAQPLAAASAPASAPEPVPQAPAPAAPKLTLPSAKDFIECLQMLGVEEVAPHPAQAAPPASLDGWYATPLLDDGGTELGAILVDRRAGAELGGGLLGLPNGTRDEQVRDGLAANTLDALNEIINNLGGIVNRANPKCHTRLKPLELAAPDAVPWLASASGRIGLTTREGGNVWIAAS